jgi:hypothetical protein
VRYDTLHRHFRAHLPELKDLGEHFPSAERLSELALLHLDFTWLGQGRMLLAHGPTREGIHLVWLDIDGFAKAAYFPAGEGSSYELTLEGDLLEVTITFAGTKAAHQLFWWGP